MRLCIFTSGVHFITVMPLEYVPYPASVDVHATDGMVLIFLATYHNLLFLTTSRIPSQPMTSIVVIWTLPCVAAHSAQCITYFSIDTKPGSWRVRFQGGGQVYHHSQGAKFVFSWNQLISGLNNVIWACLNKTSLIWGRIVSPPVLFMVFACASTQIPSVDWLLSVIQSCYSLDQIG